MPVDSETAVIPLRYWATVDIDRYIARNQPGWDRLEQLTKAARQGIATLSPGELDELVQLYQRVSAQLSYARTYYRDPGLVTRLTRIVASANGVIYGKRARSLRVVRDFFVWTFPGAVWHIRKAIAWSAALTFVPAIIIGVWLTHSPQALDASASRADRQEYVHNQFEQYYSDQPHPVFFAEVTTNNIRVSFTIFAAGILLPLLAPAALLILNGALVGRAAAWMVTEGDGARFFGFILPHGMLELSAVIISGGAALALGWALFIPGDRPRSVALREQGRSLVTVLMGLMVMFIAAGTIEGFITGSGMPTGLRVGIGALGWLAFVLYFVVRGRAAAARGITGALGELERIEADEERAALRTAAAI
jgi:uncharacterized membrane protein SpoIIM required for sporulation